MAVAEALSISDAARELGLTAHTLRYYERAGLMLEPVDRATSSHRRYSERDLNWVGLVTKLRTTGMGISAIRQYADLVREGDGNEEERLALLVEHRETVLRQLDDVQRSLAAIDYKIDFYRERIGS
jgi:DNA-binding transcriptional MerR regulator